MSLIAEIASASTLVEKRQQCAASFAPRNGMPGKDVIWLPTLDEGLTGRVQMEHGDIFATDFREVTMMGGANREA